jgi:DNA-binding GntR family transcriptional regulator
LEQRLVTLELHPGQFLQEKILTETLGLGRTPVREAVQRLTETGLLKIYPRKGILVQPVQAESLGQVLETRRVLERLLVVKAAERAYEPQRARLEKLAGALDSASDSASDAAHLQAATFFELDHQLDRLLAEACRNVFLVRSLAPLHAHCRRLWFLFRADVDMGDAARLHAHLARSVSVEDKTGAIRALNGIISVLEGLHARLEARS